MVLSTGSSKIQPHSKHRSASILSSSVISSIRIENPPHLGQGTFSPCFYDVKNRAVPFGFAGSGRVLTLLLLDGLRPNSDSAD